MSLKIGHRIILLRQDVGMTQQELAAKLNVSRQVISNWERGYTPTISPEHIAKMAQIFGCSTEYILTGQETPENIIRNALDEDDLKEFFEDLTKRDELKLLFKQVKPLKKETIKRIIKYIKLVEEEEDRE